MESAVSKFINKTAIVFHNPFRDVMEISCVYMD